MFANVPAYVCERFRSIDSQRALKDSSFREGLPIATLRHFIFSNGRLQLRLPRYRFDEGLKIRKCAQRTFT